MVERLAELAEPAEARGNAFSPEALVAFYEQMEPPPDLRSQVQLSAQKARALLHAGRSEEALELLEAAREQIAAELRLFKPAFVDSIDDLTALAALRLGEQQNCLLDHTIASCLLPIEGEGVHRAPEGAERAVELWAGLLERRAAAGDPEVELLGTRWLLNIAAMAAGRHPEGIPERWRIPAATFDSEAPMLRFRDVAPALGLDVVGLSGGVVIEDFDGDHLLDVLVSSWGLTDPLRLFHNQGQGASGSVEYVEVSEAAGLAGLGGGLNLVPADYDNDGDVDVLVLRGAWQGAQGLHPNSLLRNDTTGRVSSSPDEPLRFSDVTESAGLLDFHPTQTAAWADFDGDGWLDLFVGNESVGRHRNPCKLFLSRRDASGEVRFQDFASLAGVDLTGYVKGVAAGDFDNDGWPDLYVSRLLEPNVLLRNLGPSNDDGPESGLAVPRFEDVTAAAGVAEPRNSFPTWFFDYDGDGWLDLFVSGYPVDIFEADASDVAADALGLPTQGARLRLYHNLGAMMPEGGGRFADATEIAGLDHVVPTMGSSFGDLDADGFPDLYLGTGAPDFRALVPNRMFWNGPGPPGLSSLFAARQFFDVTTAGGFGHLQKGHGVTFADLDHDGDQDVYAVMGGAYSGDVYQNVLFANPVAEGPVAVTLMLEGTRSNRRALGARIELVIEREGEVERRSTWVSTGGSFGAGPHRQVVGLRDASGKVGKVLRLSVDWPRGASPDKLAETFDGPFLAGHAYYLVEGTGTATSVILPELTLPEPAAHHSGDHPVN